jgi:acyl-CoA reductase-like NAD-dependent aldehyde dehydrogenase
VPISTTTTGRGGTPSPGGTGGDGTGSTTTRPGSRGGPETTDGDPSAGIPQDQFCRGYAEVKGSTQAMADAIAAQQLDDLKTAYNRLTDAYLAMAETPPDVVYDQLRAVAMRYDDLGTDVNDATTIDQVKAIAERAQTGGLADDLKAVRNYGTGHC